MIHSFSVDDKHFVLDVASGAVHRVDSEALYAILSYENEPRQQVKREMMARFGMTGAEADQALDSLDMLREQGKLYTPDRYEDDPRVQTHQKPPLKALCLNVAHACNLACEYCFATQGHYHGPEALMPFEVGQKALDMLVAQSGKQHYLDVDFFGGEPLLNFEVVKKLVAYGRSLEKTHNKRFRFTLTTNGVLLDDEVTAFLNAEIDNVVLSLDGRREVHDRFRVTHAGKGSYDTVVPRFQAFVKARGDKEYYVRGTYTAYNTDFFQDILHMLNLGFTRLSLEPVVAAPGAREALTDAHLPTLYRQYELLAQEMQKRQREGRPFIFYHFMISLDHGPCLYKRLAGCGSGTSYLAVTPTGDLYPCHQFIGDESFKVGTLDTGIDKPETAQRFLKLNLYTRPPCRACWARFYCAGGCAANSLRAGGMLESVDPMQCALFKKRIECAVMLADTAQREAARGA